jgi:hypothetical protein
MELKRSSSQLSGRGPLIGLRELFASIRCSMYLKRHVFIAQASRSNLSVSARAIVTTNEFVDSISSL